MARPAYLSPLHLKHYRRRPTLERTLDVKKHKKLWFIFAALALGNLRRFSLQPAARRTYIPYADLKGPSDATACNVPPREVYAGHQGRFSERRTQGTIKLPWRRAAQSQTIAIMPGVPEQEPWR